MLIKRESFDNIMSSKFWDKWGLWKTAEVFKNTKLIWIFWILLPGNHFRAFKMLLFDLKKYYGCKFNIVALAKSVIKLCDTYWMSYKCFQQPFVRCQCKLHKNPTRNCENNLCHQNLMRNTEFICLSLFWFCLCNFLYCA